MELHDTLNALSFSKLFMRYSFEMSQESVDLGPAKTLGKMASRYNLDLNFLGFYPNPYRCNIKSQEPKFLAFEQAFKEEGSKNSELTVSDLPSWNGCENKPTGYYRTKSVNRPIIIIGADR